MVRANVFEIDHHLYHLLQPNNTLCYFRHLPLVILSIHFLSILFYQLPRPKHFVSCYPPVLEDWVLIWLPQIQCSSLILIGTHIMIFRSVTPRGLFQFRHVSGGVVNGLIRDGSGLLERVCVIREGEYLTNILDWFNLA